MTKEEKLLVTAFTGVMLVDAHELCEYVSHLYGREVTLQDFTDEFWKELRLKVSGDFGRLKDS